MKKTCLLILCTGLLLFTGCGQTAAPAAPAASIAETAENAEENKEEEPEEAPEEEAEENTAEPEEVQAEETPEEAEEPVINGPDEMQKYLGVSEEELLAEFPDMPSEVVEDYTKYLKGGDAGNIIFRTKDGSVQNITMIHNEGADSADNLFGADLTMSMEELDERISLYGYDEILVELHKYKDDQLQFIRIYRSDDNDNVVHTVYNGKTYSEILDSSPVFISYDTPVYADYLEFLTFTPADSFVGPSDESAEEAPAAEGSQEAAFDPSKYDYVLNNINDETVFGFNLADSQTFDGYMMTIGESNFIAMLKDGQYTVFVEVGLPFDRMGAPLPYPEEDGNYKLEDYLEHYKMKVLWEKDVDTAYGKGKIVRVQEDSSSVVYEKFYIQCNNSSVMMTWSRQSSDFGSEESVIEPVLDQMLTPKG